MTSEYETTLKTLRDTFPTASHQLLQAAARAIAGPTETPTFTPKSAHTPIPWHIGMNPGPIVYGPQGEEIADCRSEFLDRAENGQNARLIVRAVNAHAGLLAALKTVVAWTKDDQDLQLKTKTEREDWLDKLRTRVTHLYSIIAKAEGGES